MWQLHVINGYLVHMPADLIAVATEDGFIAHSDVIEVLKNRYFGKD